MDWYFNAPFWTDEWPPHTDALARPMTLQHVHGQRVIHVVGGNYRQSTFAGTFLLYPTQSETVHNKVTVYCLWYGYRLKTRGPMFAVDVVQSRIEDNYSGPIVLNLQGNLQIPKSTQPPPS